MSEQLNDILQAFSRIDKVVGALLIDSQGRTLAKTLEETDVNPQQQEEIFAGLQLGDKLGTLLEFGALNQSYLEFPRLNFTAEKLKNRITDSGDLVGGEALVVIAQAGANLGRIRLEIRKTSRMLEEVLSGLN